LLSLHFENIELANPEVTLVGQGTVFLDSKYLFIASHYSPVGAEIDSLLEALTYFVFTGWHPSFLVKLGEVDRYLRTSGDRTDRTVS